MFSTVGAITASQALVDQVLLSGFGAALLPTFFISKTVALVVLAFALGALTRSGSPQINSSLLAVTAVVCLVFLPVVSEGSGWPAFGFLVLLDVSGILMAVVAFNAINDAFDIRQMRDVGRQVQMAAGVGGLLFGLSIPLFVQQVPGHYLLLMIAAGFGIAAGCVHQLRPLPKSALEASQSEKPLQYRLFVLTAMTFTLMLVVDTLADFLLKVEVSQRFQSDQISAVMGPVYGVASALQVVLQLFVVNVILQRFGFRALLSAMPLFTVVGALGVLLMPGLSAAMMLRVGQMVLRRAFDDLGRVLIANPLPSGVRRLTRMVWNGYCAPLGMGIATLLLFLFGEGAVMPAAVTMVIIGLLWFYSIRHSLVAYQQTLSEALTVRRFSLGLDDEDFEQETLIATVQQALTSDDLMTIKFGLELIQSTQTPFTALVVAQLDSTDPDVRIAAIEALEVTALEEVHESLKQRLTDEQLPIVRWRLMVALSKHPTSGDRGIVERYQKSNDIEDRAGAAVVAQYLGSRVTRQTLDTLLSDADNVQKTWAVKILQQLSNAAYVAYLERLLADKDPDIVRQALHTAVAYGQSAIPMLEAQLKRTDRIAHQSVMTLARIDCRETQITLMRADGSSPATFKDAIALAAINYAYRFDIGPELAAYARSAALSAADHLVFLFGQQAEAHDDSMHLEIAHRIQATRKRLVCWLGVASQPREVFDLMPLLVARSGSAVAQSDTAKVFELLATIVKDRKLSPTLDLLTKADCQVVSQTAEDDWLLWVAQQQAKRSEQKEEVSTMNDVKLVSLLRRSSLFTELDGEALLAVIEACEVRSVQQGEVIFGPGDFADGLYVMLSGVVNIMQGPSIRLVLKPSDIFGELELLGESVRIETAKAVTECSMLFLSKSAFDTLTNDFPEVLRELTRKTIEHLREALAEKERNTDHNITNFRQNENKRSSNETAESAPLTKIRYQWRELTRGNSLRIELAGEAIPLMLGEDEFHLSPDLLQLQHPDGSASALGDGELLIGRDSRCDIIVGSDYRGVSRQHAVLERLGETDLQITCLSNAGVRVRTIHH